MSSGDRVEWHDRVDFAEIADAIGVDTTRIMAVRNPAADEVFVLFTPTDDDPPRIFSTELRRDRDGVLRDVGAWLERPGLWEQIKRSVEEKLG